MLLFLARFLLSISATFWIIALYIVKTKYAFWGVPYPWISCGALLVPVLVSFVATLLLNTVGKKRDETKLIDVQLADMEFLPVYLGYFFVSLSVQGWYTCWIVFGVVSLFTWLAQSYSFNPFLILFGYHFYHAKTENNTKVFLIYREKIAREAGDFEGKTYRGLNDCTYIVK